MRTSEKDPVPVRRLLRRTDPVEILASLIPGDPLGVRFVVRERLLERAQLIDAERATLRAMARLARYASRLGERQSLRRFVEGQVDAAIDELLLAEARAEGPAAPRSAFELFGAPLGVCALHARRACHVVNQSPLADRRAFFELYLHRGPLAASANIEGASACARARGAQRVVEAIAEELAEHRFTGDGEPACACRRSARGIGGDRNEQGEGACNGAKD